MRTMLFVLVATALVAASLALAAKQDTLTVPAVPVGPSRAARPAASPIAEQKRHLGRNMPAIPSKTKGDLKASESYYWPGYYGYYPQYGYYPYAYGYYPSYYYLG